MADFKIEEAPIIEPGNPVWTTVQAWAEMNLKRLRHDRERPTADLRSLDHALGAIQSMEALLALPDEIKTERKRDPVQNDSFDIPPLT